MAGRKRRKKLKIGRFILTLFCLFLLAGCAGVLGLVAINIKNLPAWDESALLASNSTLVYDKDETLIAKIGTENRVPISISEIPEDVQNVFIAAEDIRFYQHKGIDLRGILRALWVDFTTGEMTQGGSTITQQLVRFSLLTQEKQLNRKIQEALLALQVERHYDKKEILQMYLNKIYFGEGAYGIQAASETYFGKSVGELTIPDAALLATIVRAPSLYSPFKDEAAAKERRNTILNQMEEYQFIDAQEAAEYKAADLNILTDASNGNRYLYPYFVDYVTEQLIQKYGPDVVYTQGLKVYTTIDPKIQKIAESVMADDRNFPPATGGQEPQGAVVVLDPTNGQIRALVGGREHTNKLGWNRATMKPGRQPGSSFKPVIAYGPAIELAGLGPASVVEDAPVTYGNYTPKNDSGTYQGNVTLRTAITKSINTVAVKLLMDYVTIPKAVEFARGLGIDIDTSVVGPSLALGAVEVTPLQLAAAYGAFANKGMYTEPTSIIKVVTSDGTVEEHTPEQRQAMKESTAFLISDMLKSAVDHGTGTRAQIGRPAAGKTGTADKGKDIWFAGYTPQLVATVWIGYDTPKAMSTSYGGTYCAPIWKKIVGQALEGVPVETFIAPGNVRKVTIDTESGLLAGDFTPSDKKVTDYFVEGTQPKEADNTPRVYVEICATSGLLATEYCPDKISKQVREKPKEYCDIHTGPSGEMILPPDFQPTAPTPEENTSSNAEKQQNQPDPNSGMIITQH